MNKNNRGSRRNNKPGENNLVAARPPPLLVDYATNRASQEQQKLRQIDDTIETTCPHFEDCAGCTTGANVAQTPIVQAAQRFFSRQRYDGTFVNNGSRNVNDDNEDNSYPVLIPTRTTLWRTQAKLAVANKSASSWKNDGCVFGLYEKGSHRLLPIPDCVVHHPSINEAVAALERATAVAGIAGYSHDHKDDRSLRYVQLQVERCTGQVALTLVWSAATLKECQPGLARLIKALNNDKNNKSNKRLWHSIWCHCNDSVGNNIFSRSPGRWHRLQGPEFFREPLPVEAFYSNAENIGHATAAGWLYFTPMTFRQGNIDGFDSLARDVARAVPSGGKVCELYGGVGVLGLTALAHHYHNSNSNPLEWLRCSDENPANPRCFHRAVDSLPTKMTGRLSRRGQQRGRSHKNSDDDSGEGGMTLSELAALMEKGEDVDSASATERERPEKTSYLIATAGKALEMGQALGANVLIVDPPRRGLEDDVMDELCLPYDPDQPYVESATLLTIPDDQVRWTNDVQTLIYVSCGFDALARDCDRLLSSNAGWTLTSSTGYVLFPGSDHVETLAIFQRK